MLVRGFSRQPFLVAEILEVCGEVRRFRVVNDVVEVLIHTDFTSQEVKIWMESQDLFLEVGVELLIPWD
jgi:hypothetical protein